MYGRSSIQGGGRLQGGLSWGDVGREAKKFGRRALPVFQEYADEFLADGLYPASPGPVSKKKVRELKPCVQPKPKVDLPSGINPNTPMYNVINPDQNGRFIPSQMVQLAWAIVRSEGLDVDNRYDVQPSNFLKVMGKEGINLFSGLNQDPNMTFGTFKNYVIRSYIDASQMPKVERKRRCIRQTNGSGLIGGCGGNFRYM